MKHEQANTESMQNLRVANERTQYTGVLVCAQHACLFNLKLLTVIIMSQCTYIHCSTCDTTGGSIKLKLVSLFCNYCYVQVSTSRSEKQTKLTHFGMNKFQGFKSGSSMLMRRNVF